MEETARKIKENTSCWYAVYTAPRAEKKVKEQLDKIGVENYLPLQPVVRLWNNRKKKIFIPVVPGCLFVHISSEEMCTNRHPGTTGMKIFFLRLFHKRTTG